MKEHGKTAWAKFSKFAVGILNEVKWIVALGMIALIISTVFLQAAHVYGDSMLGTLSGGDNLIASRFAGQQLPIKRGDIVILKNTPAGENYLIKRAVAIEGDVIRFEGRDVYLNGELLEEDYITQPQEDYEPMEVTVEPGCVFVLGDNRTNRYASVDSRLFGQLSIEGHVEAKVLYNLSKLNTL